MVSFSIKFSTEYSHELKFLQKKIYLQEIVILNGKSANELFYHSLKDIESILLETNNYIISTINNEKITNLSISARRISMAK